MLIFQQAIAHAKMLSLAEIRNAQLIRQNFEESCGAAALATLINLIDKQNMTETDIIKKMGNTTDMVNFLDLTQVAKNLGYESEAYQLKRDIFEKITVPILVKIEDDPKYPHFIVVLNHHGDFVTIFDPSFGRYISSKQEFYRLWDNEQKGGFAIIIRPRYTDFENPKFNEKIFFEKIMH